MGCASSKPTATNPVARPPPEKQDREGEAADAAPVAVAPQPAATVPVGAASGSAAADGPDAASSPVADATVTAASIPDGSAELRRHPDMVPVESDDKERESRWITVFDPDEPFADPLEPKEVLVLDLKMAMEQVGDDKAFLLELIRDTLNERDKRIQELHDAMNSNDATKSRMIAHTIKGAAVNVGLKSLGRRAKIIERFCDSVIEGKSQEPLNAKANLYSNLIKGEYAKIEQFQKERLI